MTTRTKGVVWGRSREQLREEQRNSLSKGIKRIWYLACSRNSNVG